VWLRDLLAECMAAGREGADVYGITLYPIVDMPDWHGGHFMQFGMWDLVPEGDALTRVLYEPYLRELQRCQRKLQLSGQLQLPAAAA
jgi:hypothetical protein